MMRRLALLFVLCGSGPLRAQVRREWTVGGEKREAIVYAPSGSSDAPRPAVFVWHGRGGEMSAAADQFRIHRLWPEAVVVYPQGLPTPGKLTDREGRHTGWQFNAGEQGDRDLKFFDVLLASVRKDHGADGPVYAAGHSNGGRFVQLLWSVRGDAIAATAVAASRGDGLLDALKPKPALQIAGEKDRLVSFASQQKTMKALRRVNGCAGKGRAWGKSAAGSITVCPSAGGTPFVAAIHRGGHELPEEAPELIVKFFRRDFQGADALPGSR